MEGRKGNISGFFEGIREASIKSNLESLALYADEIKGECKRLGIDSSKYEHLSPITKDKDIDSWVALGNYLVGRITLGKMEAEDLKGLTYHYLKMAQISKQAYLKNAAEDLGELVVGSEK